MKELGVTIDNSKLKKAYEIIKTTNENYIIDKHERFLNSV